MKLPITRKFLVRFGVGIAAVCVALTALTVQFVDYSPYFNQGYYARTLNRLTSPPTTNILVSGELEAGFGRALLVPSLDGPVPLAGYGARKGKPAAGVHDEVFVKAIAFRVGGLTGVVVTADALIIPRDVAARALTVIRRDLGLAREQIYFGATHSHSSLGGWGKGVVAEGFAGPYSQKLSEWFSDQLVSATRAATADLKPAELGSGKFDIPELVRNRLVGTAGTTDPEFSFVAVKQLASGRTAVLGSYAAHATVLSARNMHFSGDYPGYWQRAVEQATGGFAMFLAGGVGSHSPVPGAGAFEGAEQMSRRLAERVCQQLANVFFTNVITFGVRGLDVDLPSLHVRISDQVRLRPWLSKRLLPVTDQTFLQGFRLNQTIWLSTPCDFSGELARGIKDSSHARGLDCVVTSFNGDYIGYIIPARYYHLGGYEPRRMSFYGPAAADYLDDLLRRVSLSLWPGT